MGSIFLLFFLSMSVFCKTDHPKKQNRCNNPGHDVCLIKKRESAFHVPSLSRPSLCIFTFCQAIVDAPEEFESLGFTGGATLNEPCLTVDFFIDDTADIMGPEVCMPSLP